MLLLFAHPQILDYDYNNLGLLSPCLPRLCLLVSLSSPDVRELLISVLKYKHMNVDRRIH